ncbi:MAG: ABC transporter ATP-binding protein [Acidobacteriota bacterium]|nr:MAG: ABC transporter ATP-binding protein [Acidobacteriota bacterium]
MKAPEGTLLSIRDLTVSYRSDHRQHAPLSGLCLDIREAETVGLVGESGAGKTTLAHTLLGILPGSAVVRTGEILLRGQNLLALQPSEWRGVRGRRIGLVFQEPTAALNPVMRIETQICEGMVHHYSHDRQTARTRAQDLLLEVGIQNTEVVLDSYPFQLSGGMCQRVLIASALSLEPELLICDEPTSALDVAVRNQILALLVRLQRVHKFAILFISHDLSTLELVSDRVLTLRDGRLLPLVKPSEQSAGSIETRGER